MLQFLPDPSMGSCGIGHVFKQPRGERQHIKGTLRGCKKAKLLEATLLSTQYVHAAVVEQ